MRPVTLAALFAIMVLDDDLLEPLRARRIGFMAAQTKAIRNFCRHEVVIERVLAVRAVAGFAGQGLVVGMRQLLGPVRPRFNFCRGRCR